MLRAATTSVLQQIDATVDGMQLIVGNDTPQFAIAPLVNGFVFECFNLAWNPGSIPAASGSPAAWRIAFDSYLRMQALSRSPQIDIMESCGVDAADWNTENNSRKYLSPTTDDLQKHRLSMGTSLLGNGFYGYDLRDATSAPYWFDEYSVDSNARAVEDPAKTGYLGQPLTDAVELTDAGTLVFQQNGSLILSNPDHTKRGSISVKADSAAVPFIPGVTYLLTFDWRVLETIDFPYGIQVIVAGNGQTLDHAIVPGVITGDAGTLHFPFTVPSSGTWSINFVLANGGGKVALDNIRIYQGGGPWRRDFENGLVLVNPFDHPQTFAAVDLPGLLHRTGLRRIRGTQALDVNNGQPVSADLTLGPFDAIILLADPIRLATPTVTGVFNAAGGQAGIASGAFVSIYGSNFTPLPYDDWSKAIVNGQLPRQLDGVSVTIGGKPAYIYALTPRQVNVQAPDVGNGSAQQVVVTTGGGASASFSASSQLYSPAFFPWPGNQPVATHSDYTIAVRNGTFSGATTVPAKPGEVITLWGTGFGPTNPAVPAGQQPTVAAPPTQSPVTVSLGGVNVPVLGAVLSGYAAVYQIAIQIPASMQDGDYPIFATVNGAQSPPTFSLTLRRAQ